MTSGVVLRAHPTQSSCCLVECGSGNSSAKKKSLYPAQSRSQ